MAELAHEEQAMPEAPEAQERAAAAAALSAEMPIGEAAAVPAEAPVEKTRREKATEAALDAAALAKDAGRDFVEGAVGLGVDIVEISRIAEILKRTPSFAERAFSPEERAYCDKKANPATHYALRFAAKEAVVKALGTGFTQGIWVRDIEVVRSKAGKPLARLHGRAQEIAREQGVRDLALSLSYTHSDAVACALAITDASLKESERRKDPTEELARQFKEMRGMLDEL